MGIPFWERDDVYGWYYYAVFRILHKDKSCAMRDRKKYEKLRYCRICDMGWENFVYHYKPKTQHYTRRDIPFYKLEEEICKECNEDVFKKANECLQGYELAREAEDILRPSALAGGFED